MSKELFDFEKLVVYQKSLDYLDFAYKMAEKFPALERYNLSDQFRRASLSVSLNLAEGSGGTIKEFRNFIRISKRSIKECVVCSTVAVRRGYILPEENEACRTKLAELSRMCSGLMNSLK